MCVEGAQRCVEAAQKCVEGAQKCVEGAQKCVGGAQKCVEGAQKCVEGAQQCVKGAQMCVDAPVVALRNGKAYLVALNRIRACTLRKFPPGAFRVQDVAVGAAIFFRNPRLRSGILVSGPSHPKFVHAGGPLGRGAFLRGREMFLCGRERGGARSDRGARPD